MKGFVSAETRTSWDVEILAVECFDKGGSREHFQSGREGHALK